MKEICFGAENRIKYLSRSNGLHECRPRKCEDNNMDLHEYETMAMNTRSNQPNALRYALQ